MSYNTLPIVGMYFRPPAKLLVENLAIGTPLYLMAEPDNSFDPNAIAVYIESKNIPEASHEVLEAHLPAFGLSLEAVLAQEIWHLGYIPKEFAAALRVTETVVPNVPVDVTFATAANGAARVRFAEPVL